MDQIIITMLATSVVNLLTPFLQKAGEKVVDEVVDKAYTKTKDLYDFIKMKMNTSNVAKEILLDLENSPEEQGNQAAVRARLEEIMNNDEDFAGRLLTFFKEADNVGVNVVFNTKINGDVKNHTQIGKVNGSLNIS